MVDKAALQEKVIAALIDRVEKLNNERGKQQYIPRLSEECRNDIASLLEILKVIQK